jgi:hypothetical protein
VVPGGTIAIPKALCRAVVSQRVRKDRASSAGNEIKCAVLPGSTREAVLQEQTISQLLRIELRKKLSTVRLLVPPFTNHPRPAWDVQAARGAACLRLQLRSGWSPPSFYYYFRATGYDVLGKVAVPITAVRPCLRHTLPPLAPSLPYQPYAAYVPFFRYFAFLMYSL